MTLTMMARETREIPEVVGRQVSEGLAGYRRIGARLRDLDPPVVVTAARGSSDHAALYFKYLVETHCGRPVASMGPSVASIYGTHLRLQGAAMLGISQSGASPDLLSLLEAGKAGGALTAALVNAQDAPAAGIVDLPASLMAGPEIAVAATKSYVASLVAAACIVAEWCGDKALQEALQALPEHLEAALQADWSPAEEAFEAVRPTFCVGRGAGLSIAGEAALKLKETCRRHAEAYSAAEVLHGPLALSDTGLRALVFIPDDKSRAGVFDTVGRLRDGGAEVWCVVSDVPQSYHLASPSAPHPALTPICQAVAFYVFVERLSRRLGNDPDRPHLLRKVTQTV